MSKKKPRLWPPVPQAVAPIVDNHTHLPMGDWEIPEVAGVRPSLETQLEWAQQAGVVGMITSACSSWEWSGALAMARKYPQVKVALAVHPNEAPLHQKVADSGPDNLPVKYEPHHDEPLDEALTRMEELLADPNVVAVGETGLDYFRAGPQGRKSQKEAFAAHIEIAKRHDLPMQIHDRDAHQDTIDLLLSQGAPDKTVFHCFSGDAQMAQVLAENGWYASFAGPLTYPANQHLRDALAVLPKELVLVETDAPYLTPVPHRGCPNGSYLTGITAAFIAELWECPVQDAAQTLVANTRQVYGQWW